MTGYLEIKIAILMKLSLISCQIYISLLSSLLAIFLPINLHIEANLKNVPGHTQDLKQDISVGILSS